MKLILEVADSTAFAEMQSITDLIKSLHKDNTIKSFKK